MPTITDPPPEDVKAELVCLQEALDGVIPSKRLDENLIIGTWNIKEFGGLTEEWQASPGQSPKRDLRALRFIAEIVSRFDVIAVQEVQGTLKALRHMLKVLGSHWAFLLTDASREGRNLGERLAFLFDTRRVRASGLACELVVPKEWTERVGDHVLREQFARSPYACSFYSAGQTFILVTLHIRYGESAADRIPELTAIAEWMANWTEREEQWRHNLFVLGDFNTDRVDDRAYQAFTSTGLHVPQELLDIDHTNLAGATRPRHYDHISWFLGGRWHAQLRLKYKTGGRFDFAETIYAGLQPSSLQWRISDHFPLFVEFDMKQRQ